MKISVCEDKPIFVYFYSRTDVLPLSKATRAVIISFLLNVICNTKNEIFYWPLLQVYMYMRHNIADIAKTVGLADKSDSFGQNPNGL